MSPRLSEEAEAQNEEWQRALDCTRAALEAHLRKQDLIVQQLLAQVSQAKLDSLAAEGYADDDPEPLKTGTQSWPSQASADDSMGSVAEGRPETFSGNYLMAGPGRPGRLLSVRGVTTSPSMSSQFSEDGSPDKMKLNRRHSRGFAKNLRREKKNSDEQLPKEQSSGLRLFIQLTQCAHWFSNLEEPKRVGKLASIANSKLFESLSAFVIFTNCVFTLWTTDEMVLRAMAGVESESTSIVIGEVCYNLFFFCEIIFKLSVHRSYFFVNNDMGWNFLDFLLVAISTTNLAFEHILKGAQGVNVSFLRSFRLLKITRVLRMLRVIKVCRKLRTMLDALISSCQSLVWVIVLLLVLFGLFSLLFVQLITQYLHDHIGDDCEEEACRTREGIIQYFGSVQKGMITLYMATTGGLNWIILWELLTPTGTFNCLAFLVFTLIFYFCVFNLLTGMFVDQAVKAAQPDRDMVIFEQRAKEEKEVAELRKLCAEADTNHDDVISWEEFAQMIDNEKVLLWLAAFGLDIVDAKLFFGMLLSLSDNDVVPIDIFVRGCMRMKGDATSIDLQALMFQVQIMDTRTQHCQALMERSAESVALLEQAHASRRWELALGENAGNLQEEPPSPCLPKTRTLAGRPLAAGSSSSSPGLRLLL